MAKSRNLKDKYKVIEEELLQFDKLLDGHRKLLQAIGEL
jgi:hypothetical protein